MRKVKFTQEAFDERLSLILSEFPILDVSLAPGTPLPDPSDGPVPLVCDARPGDVW